ncbi:phosphoglucosamine mutase [Caulobacter vibrioides]|uniref:Phosphoglucosamine mutase n=2 Tax=Caulobacter vibrioides TaxID=155892 RepID=GLMM_CAUVC|nr:phosphoglucosamine mutase [Caulobacter vibrioides]YP_002515491.1 phosphoglucosamine mutase [Caulobacter vibrioides NA1000]B8GXK7.1 RecName: Full=Phosphoglucosamine mutase [Caulobacter vibrioides NA1000]Q9ABV3.1 RecName: Full=Phosphoglucosamine mutase [Caulobacter vibrioides CB15]QBQ56848.1 phosphoglucosamine mutase [synthetic Caulobacter sp. 'ethensis']AAK22104.1 phosphoglucomutase/phosphomannomutase family protein [Caulobacter vibrioides CB15]ACL93583.1 phosphoglucosamine mutase [Caulobac
MSKRAYFGTDGIRGQANKHPMTAEVALRVGLAAGKLFRSQDERRHLVVIGKDTRLSGYMIEPALVAGLTSVGLDVRLFGPLPTPAVAMMTRSMRADLGIMISASHNSFADNGIKLFGPDGYKLSDAQELGIEALMDQGLQEGLAAPRELGRVKRIDDAQARYVEIVKATFPRHLNLSGLRIVIDCANGAAYKVAPTALYELGAEVITLGVSPDGTNINEECGSTHPEAMAKMVREYRADIGIALDGDADRLVICDEKGVVVDGDQIMAIIAAASHKAGTLKGGGVVATVMSNLGLERQLNTMGLSLERTAVGDRYVMQRMREGGFNVGGEQSGHLILSDFSTTGDGLIAALQVLAVMVETDKPMSALGRQFEPVPQLLENVRFVGGKPLEAAAVKEAIADGEAQLNGAGRIVVRASGTEPLIRIMAEGDDPALVKKVVKSIASAVKAA